MDMHKLGAWRATLDAALASEEATDLEPLWDELTQAIQAEPDEPELRRLRARLAEAASMHAHRHEDLLALRRLAPTDRQAWVDLAFLQHRWAFLLARGDEDDAAEEADDDTPDGDETELHIAVRAGQPASGSARALLEQEALAWIAGMLRAHAGDAAFSVQVFTRWENESLYAPWLRLTLALEAVAAHPGDDELARVLALAWADLANQAPEGLDLENAPPPMGFLFDTTGTLWDPFLQERALDALADLLARRPGDADLLACRARLLAARCDFAGASRAFAEAADAAGQLARTESQPEAQELAQQLQDELRDQGERCAGGRAVLAAAMMDGIADAMAQLQRPMPMPEDASDAQRDFAASWEQSMRQGGDELAQQLEALRAAQPVDGPDEAQRARMQAGAQQVAAGVISSILLTPLRAEPLAETAFEQDWAAALQESRAALAALAWSDLGWLEWPDYRALLRGQAVSSVWSDPAGTTVALVSCVGGQPLVDLESELEGGPMLVTPLSRGRNFLVGGPAVDTLFIEPALPLADAVALHQARVRVVLARRPGARLLRCADLPAVAAAQERARASKTRFRLEEGLTESEALGIPNDYPEVFAPMARAAVRQALDAMRARG
jgi:hypothetical protein